MRVRSRYIGSRQRAERGRSILRRTIIASLVASSLLAGPAQASTSTNTLLAGGAEWAKVNVCSTASHSLGVRASMPGDVMGRPMFTRFGAQWLDPGSEAWVGVPGSKSPWLAAGPGPWLSRQTGWTRTFAPAPAGSTFLLRGVVEMQWRRSGGGVARSRTLVTPQVCALR
jgi:hypothetical protein